MTHYDVLGVAPAASAAEIRRAYLALARRHHPDFHARDPVAHAAASRRMQEVNAAWAVLGDPVRRRAYDAGLRRPGPATSPGFVPYDDDPGGPAADLPEDLAAPGDVRHRWLAVAPVVLMAGAVVSGVVGVIVAVPALIALAAACGLLSFGLFVLAPIVVMSESARRSRP